ncbi:hypothetical protein GCM10017674_67060 [Streptomyces gardneri]|uniref:Uncharacterized protein n=1 Tax=Streptomyces gardneri TaxID=66892 RepID=A0A4Y3RMJ9_9ACTN|nr:hypothetical protein SGA01_26550 [Streptomyces gardneri]GHH16767.1 hypothetical protein GCM10017674_67060 [Streptomyces gardneri]
MTPLRCLSALTCTTSTAPHHRDRPLRRPGHQPRGRDGGPCVSGETEEKGKSAVDDGEFRYTETSEYDAIRLRRWPVVDGVVVGPGRRLQERAAVVCR